MKKRALDKHLQALQALGSTSDPAVRRQRLGAALRDRNNYLVARAAGIVGEIRDEELIPDLVAAFERLFVDPVKADPQCLAKSAIARTLRGLGYHDAHVYLRGLAHFQLEPTWGGRADSAAPLRGICALALSECPLDDIQILTHLTDGLADLDKLVRIDTVLAIDQLGRREGALLLRLKLLIGDPEPDVLGQCCTSLLSLAPDGAVAVVSRLLKSDSEDIQLEAACALAQCRDPRAIEVLTEFWQDLGLSLELRRALLISLGASPLVEATELLLSVIATDASDLASDAIAALAGSRYRAEMHERVAAAIQARSTPQSQLQATFEQAFGLPVPRAANGS